MTTPQTHYRNATIQGLNIAYREAGNPGTPKLVILHGFPASSHQYRDLIPALATRFHVIAPDYPGFGNSDMPDPASFAYTFDKLSEVMEAFLKDRGFDRYGLFVQDYGGPVGFRIFMRNPQALDWLIIQNTNALRNRFHQGVGRFSWSTMEESKRRNRSAPGRVPGARRDQGNLSFRCEESGTDQPGQLEVGFWFHATSARPPSATRPVL
jgi:pimeloyl-ACP methyl ester carboxylesterase